MVDPGRCFSAVTTLLAVSLQAPRGSFRPIEVPVVLIPVFLAAIAPIPNTTPAPKALERAFLACEGLVVSPAVMHR